MCLVQFYILREHKSSIFKSSVLLSVCQLKDSDLYIIPSMWFISQSGLDVRDMRNLYYLYLCQIFFLSLCKRLFAHQIHLDCVTVSHPSSLANMLCLRHCFNYHQERHILLNAILTQCFSRTAHAITEHGSGGGGIHGNYK